jgi:hypothetical protein
MLDTRSVQRLLRNAVLKAPRMRLFYLLTEPILQSRRDGADLAVAATAG